MPAPGKLWRHVIISTYNSWPPGDPRGFRSKHHKLHSSGDYHAPPPPGEHSGLYRYSGRISGGPVVIPGDLREGVGLKIIGKLQKLEHTLLCLAVAGMHTHLLVELPAALKQAKTIIGQCKAVSSHSIRHRLPGRVWAHDGKFNPTRDASHHENTYWYILRQPDAWVWSFRAADVALARKTRRRKRRG